MFKRLTGWSVYLVERYLPDPYIFVLLLTLIAAVAAGVLGGHGPVQVMRWWGDGFWGLLSFSMQMLLVLLTGHILASSPPVKKALRALAGRAQSAGSAVILVTLVSLFASWLNWGFGLVVGALFAREVGRKVKVDYRLLVASAYSGFLVWHGGLAGSVPLTIATPGHFAAAEMGVIPTSETLFSSFNLLILLSLFIAVPLLNWLMLPAEDESVYVDVELLNSAEDEEAPEEESSTRPAERLENSRLLAALIAAMGLFYLLDYFVMRRQGLNLDIVNFIFLFFAILLHGTPRRLLKSLQEAIKGGAGIVIQFPFYAGIMAVMVDSGLAQRLSEWFASFSTALTLPFWTFLSAGLLNLFVPSGGGQWAVQSAVVISASEALGADLARVSMAVAWGDAWTNMLQPFWALPVLAIAGLKAKDMMGFCLIQLFVSGIIIAAGLTWF